MVIMAGLAFIPMFQTMEILSWKLVQHILQFLIVIVIPSWFISCFSLKQWQLMLELDWTLALFIQRKLWLVINWALAVVPQVSIVTSIWWMAFYCSKFGNYDWSLIENLLLFQTNTIMMRAWLDKCCCSK